MARPFTTRHFGIVLASLFLLCVSATHAAAGDLGRPGSAAPNKTDPLYLRDGMFDPLVAPEIMSAKDADWMPDGMQVLGIEIDGRYRAYPMHVLAYHQAVNDTVGGRDILVTYDLLGGLCAVFPRDRAVTHRVVGYLRGTLVLGAKQGLVERPIWSPYTGRPVRLADSEPRAKARQRFTNLEITTWGSWRTRHPATDLVMPNVDYRDRYYRPRGGYVGTQSVLPAIAPTLPAEDERLGAHEIVAGLGGTHPEAVAVDRQARTPHLVALEDGRWLLWKPNAGSLGRAVAFQLPKDQRLVLQGDQLRVDGQSARYHLDGRAVQSGVPALERTPALVAEWYAWRVHHPDTRLHDATPAR